jgi:hypothetical protein
VEPGRAPPTAIQHRSHGQAGRVDVHSGRCGLRQIDPTLWPTWRAKQVCFNKQTNKQTNIAYFTKNTHTHTAYLTHSLTIQTSILRRVLTHMVLVNSCDNTRHTLFFIRPLMHTHTHTHNYTSNKQNTDTNTTTITNTKIQILLLQTLTLTPATNTERAAPAWWGAGSRTCPRLLSL